MARNKSKLYTILSNVDFELLAGLVLFLIAAQPLYGIFEVVSSQQDLVALFYAKATVVRFIGICGIAVGIGDYYVKVQKYGYAYVKKHLFGNPWNFLFLLMLVWSIITSLGAVQPKLSFFSYAYRYEGLLSYFAYAGVFMCGSIIKNDDRRKKILDFAIIFSAIVALATIIQENSETFQPLTRNGWVGAYSGTFINANHYGYYLAIILMVCAGRFYEENNPFKKVLIGLAFAFNTWVLLFNNSFGPYLAVSVALAVMFIIYTVRNGIRRSWQSLIMLAVFLGLGAIINNGLMIKTYYNIFKEFVTLLGVVNDAPAGQVEQALSEHGSSGSGRLNIWLAAFDVWKQHVWTGCGPENVPMEMYEALGSYEATHNTYLQIMAEMGLIGLFIYMAAHITFFIRNAKKARVMDPSALIAYGAVCCYLISACFGITITVCEVFLYFVLGITNGYHTEEPVRPSKLSTTAKGTLIPEESPKN